MQVLLLLTSNTNSIKSRLKSSEEDYNILAYIWDYLVKTQLCTRWWKHAAQIRLRIALRAT